MLVALAVVITVSLSDSWPGFVQFFADVTALAVTGGIAALALMFGVGGFTTLRRVTV